MGVWAAMVQAESSKGERLSAAHAVSLYTSRAAYCGFDEDRLGALGEGRSADLTILDSDIRGTHPAILRRVRVAATIVNGSVVYSSDGAA